MRAARWLQGDLIPFGGSPSGLSLWGGVRRDGGQLHLRFELQGALGDVRIPAPAAAPARRDGLWQHTCFEAFVAGAGRNEYFEINLAPSGDWACYAFTGYRAGQSELALEQPPSVAGTQPSAGVFALEAALGVPGLAALAAIEIGLTAVIERDSGDKAYWALTHRGVKPDFHLRDSFTLRMA